MPRRKAAARLYLDPARKQWVIRDGSSFIRTGCSETEARQAEIELAAYVGKKHRPVDGPNPSIPEILLAYDTEHLPTTKAVKNAKYNISNLEGFFGDLRLSDITPAKCREYARTKSQSGARRDLETLRAAIHYWAKEHGPVGVLPSIILPDKPEPRDRWLTRDEAKRLRYAAMKWPHLYRFVVIGLLTGSRSGAILKMEWDWVDLGARIMRRRAFGEAEDSRKRTPPVRIAARLARLLRLWKRQDEGKSRYIVHYNGRPITKLKRAWALACKDAGLDGVTPHTLRHTRATWLMQEGIEIWEAAGHLGMSPDMLTRNYAKHHPNFQDKAAEV